MHSIPQEDWDARFRIYMMRTAGLDPANLIHVDLVETDLSSWKDGGNDWLYFEPEDAAQETLSCWYE